MRVTRVVRRLKYSVFKKRLRELGRSVQKKKAVGGVIDVYNNVLGGVESTGPLFS